jgi:tetratricopeptide (TPR) repeat protein
MPQATMLRTALILALVAGPPAAPGLRASGAERDGAVERALELNERGDFLEARRIAAAALAKDAAAAGSAAWERILARSYQLEGDLEEAMVALARAVASSSGGEREEALVELAQCHLEMWDAAGARKALAGAAAPSDRVRELLAMADFLDEKEDSARRGLESLADLGASGWYQLGLIAFHRSDFSKAEECFGRSTRADDSDYYAWLHWGWSLLELNRLKEAEAALGRAQRLADTAEVRHLLGRSTLRGERLLEAERWFRSALEAAPEHPEAQFGLATVLRRLGRTEEARGAFDRFRSLHRKEEERLRRGYGLHQKLQSRPDDVDVIEALGSHSLEGGDAPEAERLGWRGVRVAPDRPGPRLLLARAFAASGRFGAAAVQYRKLLKNSPGHAEAQSELRLLIERHARERRGDARD